VKARDFSDYVCFDILNSVDEIEEFTEGMSFEEFAEDKKTINAVIRGLKVLGEAAKKIPDNIRKRHPEIPWTRMAGMRDKLIHQYFGVDLETVWVVVQKELPPLKPCIQKVWNEVSKKENKSL